jgi:hypothetical protein
MVCKTDRIWLCHNKWYEKQAGSGYVIKMVCKTDRIWLCHNKGYVKQTGSGYVIINGM